MTRLVLEFDPDGGSRILPFDPGSAAPAKGESEAIGAALAAARQRGQRRVAEILAGPEMLTADEMAALLGTTRATIHNKRNAHRLLAVEGATRGYRFPSWQIDADGKPLSALPALFACFDGSAWAVYRFLVQKHPELGGQTGLASLRAGRADRVLAVAERVASISA